MPRHNDVDDIRPLETPARTDGRIEARIIDFVNADVDEHLHYLFNGTQGYVFLATLDRSESKPVPRDKAFKWPDQYDEMIEWIAEGVQRPWTEVFICPYPMRQREITEGDTKRSGRKAGASASRWIIHADIDHPLTRAVSDRLKAWGFRAVASGTPGHVQVYARLSRSLTVAEHRGLAQALRTFVDGDDKISDNDYVKLPGSWNHKNHPNVKQEKRNDRKYPVALMWPGRPKVDADRLIADLKANPIEAETAVAPRSEWKKITGSWLFKLPPYLQEYVHMESDGEDSGRFKQCHAAVMAFSDAGHDRDHIHTALDDFDPGVEKWGRDRWHDEIDRILGKQRGVAVVGEGFWERRPILQHIYDTAIANLASPWATLGVVMANCLCGVPHNVHLPAVSGPLGAGIRSLNYFVLLAGASNQGKGTATQAGFHAVKFGHVARGTNVGSGQGVGRIFKRPARKGEEAGTDGGGMVWERRSAYLDIPEVGILTSIIGSKDNTLAPELCKAWAGEILGTQTNTTDRNVTVEKDSYRLCAIVGGQPAACGPLFARADIGLPQRFMYLPVDGDEDEIPEDPVPVPEAMVVELPAFGAEGYVIKFPDEVRRQVWEHRRDVRKKRLKIPELERHGLLLRIKTAVALAFMDGRPDMNEEDWELAGIVMAKSAATIRHVQAELRAIDVRSDTTRGVRAARTDIAKAKAIDTEKYNRVKRRVMDALQKHHDAGREWAGGLGKKMPSVPTADLNWGLDMMVARGLIERREAPGRGHQYRLKT